jgi:hypothetical protein
MSVKDVEQLIKPPAITQKDLHHGSGRRTSILPSASIHEVFRDYKPTRLLRSNLDPVSTNGQHLLELFGLEKKGSIERRFLIPIADVLIQKIRKRSCISCGRREPRRQIFRSWTTSCSCSSNIPEWCIFASLHFCTCRGTYMRYENMF